MEYDLLYFVCVSYIGISLVKIFALFLWSFFFSRAICGKLGERSRNGLHGLIDLMLTQLVCCTCIWLGKLYTAHNMNSIILEFTPFRFGSLFDETQGFNLIWSSLKNIAYFSDFYAFLNCFYQLGKLGSQVCL